MEKDLSKATVTLGSDGGGFPAMRSGEEAALSFRLHMELLFASVTDSVTQNM